MQETIPQHSNSNISNITLLFSYENFQEKEKAKHNKQICCSIICCHNVNCERAIFDSAFLAETTQAKKNDLANKDSY